MADTTIITTESDAGGNDKSETVSDTVTAAVADAATTVAEAAVTVAETANEKSTLAVETAEKADETAEQAVEIAENLVDELTEWQRWQNETMQWLTTEIGALSARLEDLANRLTSLETANLTQSPTAEPVNSLNDDAGDPQNPIAEIVEEIAESVPGNAPAPERKKLVWI